MDLLASAELAQFRDEARTWLAENAPDEPRPPASGPELRAFDERWQRRQYDGGWAGISWDQSFGGRGLSLFQQIVWHEELVRSGAPGPGVFGVAFAHAGPTLMACGSQEQQQHYLPRILRGETPWSQGFSEPEAGSDLAALRCRGTVDGDTLVVTGAKLWTSYAEHSDYGELLVRTDASAGRHGGLTWVIMDMHRPGVQIRPILSMDGYPHNCAVFYDDVRVPLASVVGGVGNGWSVAMATLAAERGPGFVDVRLARIAMIDALIDHARQTGKLADEAVYAELAELRAAAAALRSMAYLQASAAMTGSPPGAETTAVRSYYVQLAGRCTRAALRILGPDAIEAGPWTRQWLEDFNEPIAGGTIDIQRNIIGERVLGLPR